jgi:hypothetical protein
MTTTRVVGAPIQISGVPDSVPRSAVLALLTALGVDPELLFEFKLGHNGFEFTVVALDENGKNYPSPFSPNEVAKHHVIVPIKEDEVSK